MTDANKPMADARWAELRDTERYTWFRPEQAEVTAYVESLRSEVDRLTKREGELMAERDELDRKLTIAQALLDGAYI